MKSLIIADIHANLAALDAVFAHERTWDELLFLGDAAGGGPQPEEVVQRLRTLNGVWIRGNHDAEMLYRKPPRDGENPEAAYIRWTIEQLSDESRRFLALFEPTQAIERDGLRIRLIHGDFPITLGLLERFALPIRIDWALRTAMRVRRRIVVPRWSSRIYPDTDESVYRAVASWYREEYILIAHTHVQFRRRVGQTEFINPGSVGQPRLGQPLAMYAVLQDGVIEQRGVPYDTEATCRALDAVPLPDDFKESWRQAYRCGRLPHWCRLREWEPLIRAGYR